MGQKKKDLGLLLNTQISTTYSSGMVLKFASPNKICVNVPENNLCS